MEGVLSRSTRLATNRRASVATQSPHLMPSEALREARRRATMAEIPNSVVLDFFVKQHRRKTRIIGGYRIGKKLGEGRFGTVYLGVKEFEPAAEPVAIKVITRDSMTSPRDAPAPASASSDSSGAAAVSSGFTDVQREAKLMRLLRHPNVIELRDVIQNYYHICLIMEYAPNGDLWDRVKGAQGGRLSEDQARVYFIQVVNAVSFFHSRFVVHRDLKPENLLLDRHGHIRVSDFGFSSIFNPDRSLKNHCGSVAYSAPEVLGGQTYTGPESDIWSLGVILYFMVAGKEPFEGASDYEVYCSIREGRFLLPNFFSSTLCRLLRLILVPKQSLRIQMPALMRHPWLHGRKARRQQSKKRRKKKQQQQGKGDAEEEEEEEGEAEAEEGGAAVKHKRQRDDDEKDEDMNGVQCASSPLPIDANASKSGSRGDSSPQCARSAPVNHLRGSLPRDASATVFTSAPGVTMGTTSPTTSAYTAHPAAAYPSYAQRSPPQHQRSRGRQRTQRQRNPRRSPQRGVRSHSLSPESRRRRRISHASPSQQLQEQQQRLQRQRQSSYQQRVGMRRRLSGGPLIRSASRRSAAVASGRRLDALPVRGIGITGRGGVGEGGGRGGGGGGGGGARRASACAAPVDHLTLSSQGTDDQGVISRSVGGTAAAMLTVEAAAARRAHAARLRNARQPARGGALVRHRAVEGGEAVGSESSNASSPASTPFSDTTGDSSSPSPRRRAPRFDSDDDAAADDDDDDDDDADEDSSSWTTSDEETDSTTSVGLHLIVEEDEVECSDDGEDSDEDSSGSSEGSTEDGTDGPGDYGDDEDTMDSDMLSEGSDWSPYDAVTATADGGDLGTIHEGHLQGFSVDGVAHDGDNADDSGDMDPFIGMGDDYDVGVSPVYAELLSATLRDHSHGAKDAAMQFLQQRRRQAIEDLVFQLSESAANLMAPLGHGANDDDDANANVFQTYRVAPRKCVSSPEIVLSHLQALLSESADLRAQALRLRGRVGSRSPAKGPHTSPRGGPLSVSTTAALTASRSLSPRVIPSLSPFSTLLEEPEGDSSDDDTSDASDVSV